MLVAFPVVGSKFNSDTSKRLSAVISQIARRRARVVLLAYNRSRIGI